MLRGDAERCRKLHTGSVDWSVKITHALQLLRYWKLFVRKLDGKKVSKKQLMWIAEKLKFSYPPIVLEEEKKKELKVAKSVEWA